MLSLVRTCRPDKPGVGLTRQSRCPERTQAYFKEASMKRDIHWFNWQLRSTTFHIKNFRNQRKNWFHFIRQILSKYRLHYIVLSYTILSYLAYDKLPHPRIERLIPIAAFDDLDYKTVDLYRICCIIADRLVTLGYPFVGYHEISEMDVYLSYYKFCIKQEFCVDVTIQFEDLYLALKAKKVKQKSRIIYSHMMAYNVTDNYNEGYTHIRNNYKFRRSEHYLWLWIVKTQLMWQPRVLAEYWFKRMKYPSLKIEHG